MVLHKIKVRNGPLHIYVDLDYLIYGNLDWAISSANFDKGRGYFFFFFSSFLFLGAVGHMDKANCSGEGPLPLGGRGHPSEQTCHQGLIRVKMQTPRKEVLWLITSLLVIVFVLCFVLFRAVCHFCSIRGNHIAEEGKK